MAHDSETIRRLRPGARQLFQPAGRNVLKFTTSDGTEIELLLADGAFACVKVGAMAAPLAVHVHPECSQPTDRERRRLTVIEGGKTA